LSSILLLPNKYLEADEMIVIPDGISPIF
jgi:hypothetical protein